MTIFMQIIWLTINFILQPGICKLRRIDGTVSNGAVSSRLQAAKFQSLSPTSFPFKAKQQKFVIDIIFSRFVVNSKPFYFILIHF